MVRLLMHISSVYSPLELTYSIEIPLTDAKNTAQLLTFRVTCWNWETTAFDPRIEPVGTSDARRNGFF